MSYDEEENLDELGFGVEDDEPLEPMEPLENPDLELEEDPEDRYK